jgi:hypothetical protein
MYTERWWFNPETRQVERREFYVDTTLGYAIYYLAEMRFGCRQHSESPVSETKVFQEKHLAHLSAVAVLTEEISELGVRRVDLEEICQQHKTAARQQRRIRTYNLDARPQPDVEELILEPAS